MSALPDDTPVGAEIRPVDRRVRRTQKAIRDAFISLVLERGYDHVLIEDIAQRADIGRATFYAHYSDKENLFATLFAGLSDELAARVADVSGSPHAIRTYLNRSLYEDAYKSRDLFRICLSGAGNGRARASYQQTVENAATHVFSERIKASPYEQRFPAEVMARVFAAAHVATLQAWLEEDPPSPVDDAVNSFVHLLFYGFIWGLGMVPDEYIERFPEI